MTTERKNVLSCFVLVIVLIGMGFLVFILGSSLNPNAGSSEVGDHLFWVRDIEVSGQKEAVLLGRPILIERVTETKFQV